MPMIRINSCATRLSRWLEERALSRYDFSNNFGLSYRLVSAFAEPFRCKWQDRQYVSELARLSEVTGIAIDDLVEDVREAGKLPAGPPGRRNKR